MSESEPRQEKDRFGNKPTLITNTAEEKNVEISCEPVDKSSKAPQSIGITNTRLN
jgi:hypothetical protein